MTKSKSYYKTVVTYWSTFPTEGVNVEDLGYEAMQGDAMYTDKICYKVMEDSLPEDVKNFLTGETAILSHQDAKNYFTDEAEWTFNKEVLFGLAENFGILFNDDDSFSHIASQVWDEMPDEMKDNYRKLYAEQH